MPLCHSQMNGILIHRPLDRQWSHRDPETWSLASQLCGRWVPPDPIQTGPSPSVYLLYLAFKTILSWLPTFIRSSGLGHKLNHLILSLKTGKSGTKITSAGHHWVAWCFETRGISLTVCLNHCRCQLSFRLPAPRTRRTSAENTSPQHVDPAGDCTARRIGYYWLLFPVHGVPAVPVPAQCVYLYRHLYLDSPPGPGLLSCARLRVAAKDRFFRRALAGLSRTFERPGPARREERETGTWSGS